MLQIPEHIGSLKTNFNPFFVAHLKQFNRVLLINQFWALNGFIKDAKLHKFWPTSSPKTKSASVHVPLKEELHFPPDCSAVFCSNYALVLTKVDQQARPLKVLLALDLTPCSLGLCSYLSNRIHKHGWHQCQVRPSFPVPPVSKCAPVGNQHIFVSHIAQSNESMYIAGQ